MTQNKLPECPVTIAVNLICNKWKPLIMHELFKGSQRYKHLQYIIKGIRSKVLTENLKQLEKDGLVERTIFAEVPLRVEYSLTILGEQIRPIIMALAEFGKFYKENYKLKE